MTDRKNIKFEIERFSSIRENYEKSKKPVLNLQSTKSTDAVFFNYANSDNIKTEKETYTSIKLEAIPDVTRSNSMPIEKSIMFPEHAKYPQLNLEEIEVSIKEENKNNKISNLRIKCLKVR